MSRHLAAAVFAFGAPALAQAPIVQTVLNNGTTQSRYDMVILGDGYQATEQWKFDQDVLTFLTGLFQKQPYQTFAAYYNVHTVFRASNQSGADEPDVVPPVFVDTAYDSTYNTGGVDRCLYIGDSALGLADAALAPANEGRILVMVNSSRYGGCAGTFAVSYNGGSMVEVQSHELGHSMGQLADEYDYPNDTYTGSEPSQVNATTSTTGQKWAHWHGTDGVSAFEGCRYYLHGLYRPRSNCLMRNLGAVMCPVCREQVSKVTNSIVDTIVSESPAGPVLVSRPNVQIFSMQHIVPAVNNPLITWKLDGATIPAATGTSYALDSNTVSVGAHTLAVSVLDQTTLVRLDPASAMLESHSWQFTVDDPGLSQLRPTAISSSLTWLPAGSPLLLTATIVNEGSGTAANFAVEFFLSDSPNWNTQDIYLGRSVVSGLAGLQTTVVQHLTQLPWRLPPQLCFVHVVVDRTNQIAESNDNDNTKYTGVFSQVAPCVTKLEYDDQLATSFDSAPLSAAAGGTVHPTVVAPCADPLATIYLIAWGGSGTSPGLPLSPSVVLPLNPDSLTDLGLSALNGPVLVNFVGLLGANGVGRATFALPPATGITTGQTHFAVVLLGGAEFWQAASNPLGLTLAP